MRNCEINAHSLLTVMWLIVIPSILSFGLATLMVYLKTSNLGFQEIKGLAAPLIALFGIPVIIWLVSGHFTSWSMNVGRKFANIFV
jgi:hypothetical protein